MVESEQPRENPVEAEKVEEPKEGEASAMPDS